MWEENSSRRMNGEKSRRDQSDFQEGVEAGLQVARDIATWLNGQNEAAALRQIEREKKRLIL